MFPLPHMMLCAVTVVAGTLAFRNHKKQCDAVTKAQVANPVVAKAEKLAQPVLPDILKNNRFALLLSLADDV